MLKRSIPSARFSAAAGTGSRLPPDREGQPEDVAPPDPQPVPGKAQVPFRGNRLRDRPRLRNNLDAACETSTGPEHIREAWIGAIWIVEMTADGGRDSQPLRATHQFLSSLRITPGPLLQLVRDRWSIECW